MSLSDRVMRVNWRASPVSTTRAKLCVKSACLVRTHVPTSKCTSSYWRRGTNNTCQLAVRQWNYFVQDSTNIPDLDNKPIHIYIYIYIYIYIDSNGSVLLTSQRCILCRRKLSINIDLNNGICIAACVFYTLHCKNIS